MSARSDANLRIGLALFLLALGGTIAYGSLKPLREQRYDLHWRSTTTLALGPIGRAETTSGTEQYRGAEAVRMGLGLLAFGAMLITWSVALFRPGKVLAVVSLLCLSTMMILFFPPWRLLSDPSVMALYAVLALAAVFAFALDDAARRKVGKPLCIGLIVFALIVSHYSPGLVTGAVLGFWFAVFLAVNIAVLNPPISEEARHI
jgi:hypothetical protein